MTDEEKKQLVDAVITQLKSEGTDVSNANIVSDANGIDYVVAYGKNGQIVRAVPTAISSEKVGATGYMNAYTEAGVYNINTSGGEDLPIDNQGAISARLTVLVTESGGNKVITQVLNLNNNEGGEGNVYIRSCQNGEWKAWGKLQTNVEVGQVNTLDNLTDNGIYSGVLTDGTPTSVGTFYDTFVLIVINNYAVSIPTGNPQSISQLKYSLGLDGSISVASRKRDQYGYWDNWESLDEKSLVEEEKFRAEQVEQAIKEKAVDADSLNFQTRANVVALNYKTIEEVGDEITIPAATAESAGVMSAADKVKLNNSYKDIDVSPNEIDVELDIEDNAENTHHVVIPAATAEKAGVMSSKDKKKIADNKTAIEEEIKRAKEAEANAIEQGKRAALIDMYRALGAYYNSSTDTFTFNTVANLSWAEMAATYLHRDVVYRLDIPRVAQQISNLRVINPLTNILTSPSIKIQGLNTFYGAMIELLAFCKLSATTYDTYLNAARIDTAPVCTYMYDTFRQCSKLKVVFPINIKDCQTLKKESFSGCVALEELRLINLPLSLDLDSSPLISKASILYIVTNAAPTSAITITLHADAYARLAEDADVVAALAAQPLVTLVSA